MESDGARRQGSVLIVQADAQQRDGMAELLGQEGYAVEGAAHGQEALVALAEGQLPDLIDLDPIMPVMNGWVFQAELQADPRLAALPVIILSDETDRVSGAPLPAAAYLTKPPDVLELLLLTARYCGQSPGGACDIGAIFLEGAPPSS
jgi:CheY-like chemotaxis protein